MDFKPDDTVRNLRDPKFLIRVVNIDEIQSNSFKGIVLEPGNTSYATGEEASNWAANCFTLVDPDPDPYQDLFTELDKLEKRYE